MDKDIANIIDKLGTGVNIFNTIANNGDNITKNLIDNLFENIDIPNKERTPDCNVSKEENVTKVAVNLPGVTKEDIKISINNTILSLDAKVKNKQNWSHLVETVYKKKIEMSESIIRNNINIEYTDGILYIIYIHENDNNYEINL